MITIKTRIWCILFGLSFAALGYANSFDPNTTDPNAVVDPNVIDSASDWVSLMNEPSVWDKAYILTNDIDLTGMVLVPVGTFAVPFTGSIDGGGHVIRNATLDCSEENYVGLIGYLGNEGHVSQLGVESVDITGNKFVGGLAGYSYFGSIENCYCTGSVSGQSEVGGLIGRNSGRISSCYSTCLVAGGNLVGGLAGTNFGLTAFLKACYATGTAIGSDSDGCAGGMVGKNSGFVCGCFWDMNTSGRSGSSGGKGLTTERMKHVAAYQNADWADCGWTIDDGQDYPRLAWEDAGGQPIPVAAVPLSGSGTETDPYQVSTAEDLALLSCYTSVLDKYFVVTSDIDASGIEICPIGDLGPFSGVFDGNRHVIEHLTITHWENDYVGLFGVVHNGMISKLGVHAADITGNDYVGGLVGCNLGGQIHSCYVTGKVNGQSYVGGLTGYSTVNITPH